MKKLLGILVLGLVWCSTSNANHALNQTKETRGGINYILNPLKFGSLISTNKIAESIWRAKRNKN